MDLRILSFESSSNCVSVALLQAGVIVSQTSDEAVHTKKEEWRQSAQTLLLPTIDRLLKAQGWQKDSIDCIVVGVGPGSFTGIRTAVVTARTLAQALVLPLIGMSIFDCYARYVQQEYIAPQKTAPKLKYGIILSVGKGNYLVSYYSELLQEFKPVSLDKEQMKLSLSQVALWFAHSQAKAELSTDRDIQELPILDNVAAIQAQIAHDRLSLSMSLSPIRNCSIKQRSPLKENLLQEFPFDRVEPLYVRGASVTVKNRTAAMGIKKSMR